MDLEMLDYIDSKMVEYSLMGEKIRTEIHNIENKHELTRYIFESPLSKVKSIRLLFNKKTNNHILFLDIGNYILHGSLIRSQLLAAKIKKYKKISSRTSHVYRIEELQSQEQVEAIFKIFKSYLPK